jgi:hypothetical protein
MSLKAFHVVFIVLAILLAVWVAVWGFTVEGGAWEPVLGGASVVVAIGLGVYLWKFIQKMKDVSYL